jgi:NADH:ubiquinone oxidoreductase 24 kD subunit
MKRVSTVPFTGTPAQENELKEWLAANKNEAGVTMTSLQKAQDIYGYLPVEVQTMIARELDVPLEELYGIATFYSQFRLDPVGEYKISVCLGTACYVKGSDKIFEKLSELLGIENGGVTPDGKFSLESCRCIGACGLAPVIMINDDVYGRLTGDELKGILEKY